MTHGGGTVAGESPDKSEQRKSSGETTQEERDPRLTVFGRPSPGRDAAQGQGSGHDTSTTTTEETTERPAPVDQATAVFRTTPTPNEPDAAPSGNDARLRAAVAAWVATADEPEDGSDGSKDPEGSGDSDGSQDPEGAEASESSDGSEGGSEGAQRAGEAEGSAEVPEEASSATEPVAEAAVESTTAAEPAKDPSSEAATPDGDAAKGAAVATAADAGDTSDHAEPADAEPGDADPADAKASDAATDTATAEDDTEALAAERSDSAASDGDGQDEDEDDAERGSPDAEDGEAEAPAGAEAKGEADAPAETDGHGVDQPTTMFKALRRPAVDQPTTALKMPPRATPAGKPESRPESRPEPASQPETDAERTSTFVPLRRDDVRPASAASKTPKAAAGSAPAPAAPAPAAPAPAPAGPAQPLPAASGTPASLVEAERTKQQPMPPLPPLDLLAELTNTPPPPQTPVRTVVRRVKIWTPLVLLLLVVFAVVQLVRPLPDPTLSLSAEETHTFEGGKLELPWPAEGQGAAEVVGVGSLGQYGAQKPAPIASVAKTMTAYVILRDHPITGKQVGPKITVDKKAEEESKAKSESTAPIKEGQQFTEKQMLQLLMIPSGNNAARLLARWDAGSEEAFVKKMNDAAKELGMTNSTYTDPSGLKATTVSTPLDQIKLGKAVMENDVFREIVNTTQVEIPGIDGKIRNNNDEALLMDGVGGIKTGSSTPAGGNLLWSANAVVDGEVRRIVGIVMGVQDAPQLWQKLEKAIDYSIALIPPAQEAVTSATVVKKGDVVGHVDDGLGGRTPLVATKDLKAVGWAGLQVKIEIAENGSAVPHAAKAGTVVGQVSVGEGVGKVSAPVALKRDLSEPGFGAKLTRLG
ncbi:serine hydrolase [Streptomyces sp. V1I6]|uniref:serine hydrolase n=1 Tax=Streptomyces sp. V1I6 TaxID=3042273 RepID=UPI00278649F7|nr:serine hydrolase [Streptomyces sp. V1I6]MDQ0843371.1 D-alanyl-D-alanine carboxypeptidase (penicillin-binding protein 5/6) [Streptomyces sp. V1I6]